MATSRHAGWLFLALSVHVIAIAGCAILVQSDTGQLKFEGLAYDILWLLSYPLVFSWMICPTFTIAAAWQMENQTYVFRVPVAILAIGLSLFQFWVCFPLVQ